MKLIDVEEQLQEAEQRAIYKTLIELPSDGYGFCNICRYACFSGSCEEAELECHCGIFAIEDTADDVWGGNDCWMFKPRWPFDDIVDMVGILLTGRQPDMSRCRDLMPAKLKKVEATHE